MYNAPMSFERELREIQVAETLRRQRENDEATSAKQQIMLEATNRRSDRFLYTMSVIAPLKQFVERALDDVGKVAWGQDFKKTLSRYVAPLPKEELWIPDPSGTYEGFEVLDSGSEYTNDWTPNQYTRHPNSLAKWTIFRVNSSKHECEYYSVQLDEGTPLAGPLFFSAPERADIPTFTPATHSSIDTSEFALKVLLISEFSKGPLLYKFPGSRSYAPHGEGR